MFLLEAGHRGKVYLVQRLEVLELSFIKRSVEECGDV